MMHGGQIEYRWWWWCWWRWLSRYFLFIKIVITVTVVLIKWCRWFGILIPEVWELMSFFQEINDAQPADQPPSPRSRFSKPPSPLPLPQRSWKAQNWALWPINVWKRVSSSTPPPPPPSPSPASPSSPPPPSSPPCPCHPAPTLAPFPPTSAALAPGDIHEVVQSWIII